MNNAQFNATINRWNRKLQEIIDRLIQSAPVLLILGGILLFLTFMGSIGRLIAVLLVIAIALYIYITFVGGLRLPSL